MKRSPAYLVESRAIERYRTMEDLDAGVSGYGVLLPPDAWRAMAERLRTLAARRDRLDDQRRALVDYAYSASDRAYCGDRIHTHERRAEVSL